MKMDRTLNRDEIEEVQEVTYALEARKLQEDYQRQYPYRDVTWQTPETSGSHCTFHGPKGKEKGKG
jgi:hypothetical protein